MDWYWIVWDIFICVFEAAFITYLCNSHLRIKKVMYTYVVFGFLFIGICLNTFSVSNYIIRITLNYFLFLAVTAACYNNIFIVKLVISLIPLLIFNISEGIVLNLLAFFGTEMNAIDAPSAIRFQFGAYTQIVSFILFFIASNIKIKPLKNDKIYFPTIIKIYVFIFLLLACYTIQMASEIAIWINKGSVKSVLQLDIIIITVAIMLFTIGFIVLVGWNGVLNKKHIEEVMEADRIKSQYERLKDAEALAEELRIQKHDMRGHMEVMATLINEGKTDELLKYFENHSAQLHETIQHSWMQDPSINACLAVKKSRAATYGICFDVISELMREMPLEPVDACSLIGNMLDNAIEASAKVDNLERRYICLRIVDHRDNIMISVENSAKNVTSITMGQTNKSLGHGLGLKQMNNIVKKAGGFLEIKVVPENDKVIVSAVLPID